MKSQVIIQFIKEKLITSIDSGTDSKIASYLVRICSSRYHLLERGPQPNTSELNTINSLIGRPRGTGQDVKKVNHQSMQGKSDEFDFRFFLGKKIEGNTSNYITEWKDDLVLSGFATPSEEFKHPRRQHGFATTR